MLFFNWAFFSDTIEAFKEGLNLYGSDGVYLGRLTTNKYLADSVFNEYGVYGSKYSQTSIWNQYSQYGSPYSNKSAFNSYASYPPLIYFNNYFIGYLTTNNYKPNSLSPYHLYDWLLYNGF